MNRAFGNRESVNHRFPSMGQVVLSAIVLLAVVSSSLDAPNLAAQTSPDAGTYERAFTQSRAAVEKALKAMQSNLAGHLPALEGFAQPADRALDRYQRAYYQANVQVSSTPSGGSLVRVR